MNNMHVISHHPGNDTTRGFLRHIPKFPKGCPILTAMLFMSLCMSCIGTDDHQDKTGTTGTADNIVVASCDGLELKADEFYERMNMVIRNLGFTGPEEFTESWSPYKTAEHALEQKLIMREAESLGIDQDPVFQMYLNRLVRDMHYGVIARKQINKTLPESYIDDTSPPDEAEMREHFTAFKKFLEINEFYQIHYIYLKTLEGDLAHNTSQRQKAEWVLERIQAGEDFIDIKLETTETEDSSRDPFRFNRAGQGAGKMLQFVKAMKPGEITDVIESNNGYFIVYLPPDQQISDISSLEAVQNNPEAHSKLVDYITRQRPRTYPWFDYLKNLKSTQTGFDVFDTKSLDGDELPPPETILVRLNERQWTLAEVMEIMNALGMTLVGRKGLDWAINEFSYYLLMSEKAYEGEVELTEDHELTWRNRIAREYEDWLTRHYQNSILPRDSVPPDEYASKIEDVALEAGKKMTQVTAKLKDGMIMHLSNADLDPDKVRWVKAPADNP